FFFSSRRRHTRFSRDWSSDVCSSDLKTQVEVRYRNRYGRERRYTTAFEGAIPFVKRRHSEAESDSSRERFEGYMREVPCPSCERSEERRVGKEWRSGWAAEH